MESDSPAERARAALEGRTGADLLRACAGLHAPQAVDPVRACAAAIGSSGEAVEGAVIRALARGQAAAGAGVLGAGRRLLAMHWPSAGGEEAVRRLCTDHPLVQDDRAELWVRALVAGCTGDLVGFVHLVLPQMEESLRRLLAACGVPATRPWGGGRTPRPLNDLLTDAQAEAHLGVDLTWELRALLIEHDGPNLRNRVSHGLIPAEECQGAHAEYLLWISLWMLYRFGRRPGDVG